MIRMYGIDNHESAVMMLCLAQHVTRIAFVPRATSNHDRESLYKELALTKPTHPA